MCKERKEPFIAVTNRALSRHPYLEQIERIAKRKPKAILLREKDLSEEAYEDLAKEVKKENTADNFREDIWKTLCGLGGGKDDLF